jgi:predicted nucleic acid-binding protein
VILLATSFFLDTNALIALSGLDENNFLKLSREIAKREISIYISHVQIDEQYNREFSDYQRKIREALKKFSEHCIEIIVKPTTQLVWDVSRWNFARFGSKKLGEIDDFLRQEIEKCMGKKHKGVLNVARDALIALSSLNHDYFITNDECLYKGWKIVVESNKNKKALKQGGYKLPQVIRRKTTKSVFQAIINFG